VPAAHALLEQHLCNGHQENNEEDLNGDVALSAHEDTREDPAGHGGAHRLVAQAHPHGPVQMQIAHAQLETASLQQTPGRQ
jgi:hypothetical protein